MTIAVNLSNFGRIRFVDDQGRLTREAQIQLNAIQQRSGGVLGDITAASISNVPAGGIAATNVQDAIDELSLEKQDKDATLTAVAGVTTAANKLIYWTGVDAASVCDFTAFARSILACADASSVLTTLGVSAFAKTILDDADAAAVRTTLGLVIGTNVQAYDAALDTWAGKTAPTGTVVGTSDSQTLTDKTLTSPVINNPTGTMTLAAGTLGYAAGNGGTVTQLTNKSTAVTLNKMSGQITMAAGNILAAGRAIFTLNNSLIEANDFPWAQRKSGGTDSAYRVWVDSSAAGTAQIVVENRTAGTLDEAVVIEFIVFKGAVA